MFFRMSIPLLQNQILSSTLTRFPTCQPHLPSVPAESMECLVTSCNPCWVTFRRRRLQTTLIATTARFYPIPLSFLLTLIPSLVIPIRIPTRAWTIYQTVTPRHLPKAGWSPFHKIPSSAGEILLLPNRRRRVSILWEDWRRPCPPQSSA